MTGVLRFRDVPPLSARTRRNSAAAPRTGGRASSRVPNRAFPPTARHLPLSHFGCGL